ncbi:MAG: hypothetical protein A3I78_11915 [Gammaproteobacteria bacterium RIFCSPLOWO2_02_FULL_56_15]|nr:MAG: hypothetical protein A3I78_11915 [Gammaproteobacteria bacterium RIFCSPLOWO2_02_FULL_56_15]
MKLEIDSNQEGYNKIDAYSAGNIVIAGRNFTRSLIVTPRALLSGWPPAVITEMKAEHLDPFLEIMPEVLLIGTGQKLVFPDQEILLPLFRAGIGCEIMDTGAACRSYNFLVGEGRHVAAALFMIQEISL